MVFDVSSSRHGWIRVYGDINSKEKLRVVKGNDEVIYTAADGANFIIPLQFGAGIYRFYIYRLIEKKTYKCIGSRKLNAKFYNFKEPFLHPNVYVDYDDAFADSIVYKFINEEDYFSAVKNYVVNFYNYDYIRALLKKDAMPDIQRCYEKKLGTCQDLAAMTVAIWRSLGIPAKLVIGYVGKNYHAWVEYLKKGVWEVFDPTVEILGRKKKGDYKVERWY